MIFLKLKLNNLKQEDQFNTNFILYIDTKEHNKNILRLYENSKVSNEHRIFNYVPFIFPWGADRNFDKKTATLVNFQRPVFRYTIGVCGLGNCFGFPVPRSPAHAVVAAPAESQQIHLYTCSSFQSTQLGLAIVLQFAYLLTFRDVKLSHQLINESVGYLTKYSKKISKDFKSVSIVSLVRYCVDESNELMTMACNIIIYSILNHDLREEEMNYLIHEYTILTNLNILSLKKTNERQLSISEVQWIIAMSYISIYYDKQKIQIDVFLNRIIDAIELSNCLQYPFLVGPLMKILTEGIMYWKQKIPDFKQLLCNLIFIYFHYNTSQEYLELLKEVPTLQNKKMATIEQFQQQPEHIRKRMKILTIK